MKNPFSPGLLTASLTLFASAVLLSGQDIISVNIGGAVDETRVLTDFGVADYGTVVGNWNNIGFDFANPIFDDGTESTILVETTFPWGKDGDDGFDRRYGSGTVGTPLHHGPNVYPATPDVQLTFSGLRTNFPEGYYIIAYLGGFASKADVADNEGSISDGRTTFYWKNPYDLTVVVTPETLIETTTFEMPESGNYPVAHYAVFGSKDFPKISDSYTLTVQSNSRAVSIGGVQIVSATYEPGAGEGWAGYDIDENGLIYTGVGFLGWLIHAGNDNYVYSALSQQFIYTEADLVESGAGAWIYLYEQSNLMPVDISGQWFASDALATWVYSEGAEVGTGPGWVYVLDLSVSEE